MLLSVVEVGVDMGGLGTIGLEIGGSLCERGRAWMVVCKNMERWSSCSIEGPVEESIVS